MKAEMENQNYLHSEEFLADKIKILATALTPEQLEDYRLRNSPAAMTLRAEVQYFDCTLEEFKALLELRGRSRQRVDFFDRTAIAEEVRPLLGEVRAKEFARVTDMFYANGRRVADERGLPIEQAERGGLRRSIAAFIWALLQIWQADCQSWGSFRPYLGS